MSVPVAGSSESPAAPRASNVSSAGLFRALAMSSLVLLSVWGLAHGPAALRRPWLTPALLGVAYGLFAQSLARSTRRRVTPLMIAVVGGLAGAAVVLVHVERFHLLQQASLEQSTDARPAMRLPGLEDWLTQAPVSEAVRRQWRLAHQPTFRDYLAQRSELLWGAAAARWAWLGLASEVLLAAAAAIVAARLAESRRGGAAESSTDTQEQPR